jgi:hypothetical protein
VTELAALVVVALAIGAVGAVIGMLLVPRLERLGRADDEEPGDGHDPPRD